MKTSDITLLLSVCAAAFIQGMGVPVSNARAAALLLRRHRELRHDELEALGVTPDQLREALRVDGYTFSSVSLGSTMFDDVGDEDDPANRVLELRRLPDDDDDS